MSRGLGDVYKRQLINSVTALYFTARDNIGDFVEWISKQEFIANNKKLLDFIENSYDSLDANLDAWIKNTLLPSMQNILSGAAVGVVNVVTWIKNFVIGLIVSVYLLASRKKFGQQGKLILYSLVKPRWADLFLEEICYADKMFGGFIIGICESLIKGAGATTFSDAFTFALLIVVLWKYEEVLEVLGYVGHLIFPFLLGGAIAFVLNVPMNFIERHLFTEKVRKNKVSDKLARPVSLLSVLCIVVGVLTVVIFGVVPQLVNTFGNLGQSITQFIPHAQAWGEKRSFMETRRLSN